MQVARWVKRTRVSGPGSAARRERHRAPMGMGRWSGTSKDVGRKRRVWISILARLVLIAAGVATVLLVAGALVTAGRERDCLASGGRWQTWGRCLPPLKACSCHERTLPVGAVFADGCNMCECGPHSMRCTSKACMDGAGVIGCWDGNRGVEPCSAEQPCVYDPGCEQPRSYPGGFIAAEERDYCGCDGVTFKAVAPRLPYRHVGACPQVDDSRQRARTLENAQRERDALGGLQ